MNVNNPRSYGCKDEELPMIGSLLLLSFKRDIAEFKLYSPKFSNEYVSGLEAVIGSANELIEPKSETLAKKLITDQLHAGMDALYISGKNLKGYLDLGYSELKISAAEFGVTALSEACHAKDLEAVVKSLNLVNININIHKTVLMKQGLTEDAIAAFKASAASLTNLKTQQYGILTNRKNIVQNNLGILNGLYAQITEITNIGKILYKDSNPVKYKEYLFTEIKKQVHMTSKAPANDTAAAK
jgi:hypothetical protein